jgi:hypothetical protein
MTAPNPPTATITDSAGRTLACYPGEIILDPEPPGSFELIPPTPIPLGGPTAAEPTADDAPRGKVYGGQQINVGDEVFWVWQIITVQQLRFGRYGHWLPLSVGCLPARVGL